MLLLHHVLLVQVVLLLLLQHELVLVRGPVVARVARAHQVRPVRRRAPAQRVRLRHLARLGAAAAPIHLPRTRAPLTTP